MKTQFMAGQSVIVNTGGKDATGVVTGDEGYYYKKEHDAYRVTFENGTTQWMPAKYIRTNFAGINV